MKKSLIRLVFFSCGCLLSFNIATAETLNNSDVEGHADATQNAEDWYQNRVDYWKDKDDSNYVHVPWDNAAGDYQNVRESIINSQQADKEQMQKDTEVLRYKLESQNPAHFEKIRESYEDGTVNDLGGNTELRDNAKEAYENNLQKNKEKKNKDGSSKSDYQNRLLSGAVFTGDERLACEAKMCLKSPVKPKECNPSLARYHSIKKSTSSKTRRARKAFLDICKEADSNNFGF